MKWMKKSVSTVLVAAASVTALAGHHEKGEGVMLAAQPGQMLIVYHWPCADAALGLSLLREMIAYERDASPYSSVWSWHNCVRGCSRSLRDADAAKSHR